LNRTHCRHIAEPGSRSVRDPLERIAETPRVRQTLVEHLGGSHGEPWYSFKEPKPGKGRSVDLDAGTVARLKAQRKAQNETPPPRSRAVRKAMSGLRRAPPPAPVGVPLGAASDA